MYFVHIIEDMVDPAAGLLLYDEVDGAGSSAVLFVVGIAHMLCSVQRATLRASRDGARAAGRGITATIIPGLTCKTADSCEW